MAVVAVLAAAASQTRGTGGGSTLVHKGGNILESRAHHTVWRLHLLLLPRSACVCLSQPCASKKEKHTRKTSEPREPRGHLWNHGGMGGTRGHLLTRPPGNPGRESEASGASDSFGAYLLNLCHFLLGFIFALRKLCKIHLESESQRSVFFWEATPAPCFGFSAWGTLSNRRTTHRSKPKDSAKSKTKGSCSCTFIRRVRWAMPVPG